jgi:ABC-type phosphate/phosphonate transport system substrate-binding protein
VTRADSGIESIEDLRGKTIGVGAVDSPQATLIPVSHLRSLGLGPGSDVKVRRFDVGVGLHGDHVGGERDAARALIAGDVDAACMIDANLLVFTNEGTLPAGATRVLTQTPGYDHCNMTVTSTGPRDEISRFEQLLREMAYDDPVVRPLLDLEGLKQWVDGRTSGYALLERAVDESGFYDGDGGVHGYDDAG